MLQAAAGRRYTAFGSNFPTMLILHSPSTFLLVLRFWEHCSLEAVFLEVVIKVS